MSHLYFPFAGLVALAEHAKGSPSHQPDLEGNAIGPSLTIAGDHGVYMLSNGLPMLPKANGKPGTAVVYAEGCDPDKDDDWYDLKRSTFGGDDGIDDLGLVDMILDNRGKGISQLRVDFTRNSMGVYLMANGKSQAAVA